MEAPTLSVRTNEEHHLILREKYPLIKSVGFNAAIALFMLGSSVLLWTGVMANTPIFNNPNSYTAAVGDALPPTAPAVATSTAILPFSDEVTITRNKEENAVLVQPVFRDAMSTDTYEYTVVPHKEVEIIGVGE